MDDERIIINVKGVSKTAWNDATQAASLRKVPYGEYLSDALRLRLRYDAGEVKPPGEADSRPANPPLTPDQRTARFAALAELAKGIAALKQATGRATGISALSHELTGLLADAPDRLRLIRGQSRGSRGKESGVSGQSGLILEAALPETDSLR